MKQAKHFFALLALPAALGFALSTPAHADPKDAPPVLEVKALLKNPEAYWNKTIVVEGLVTQVCPRSGQKAWLHDLDPEATGLVRVERTGNSRSFGRNLEGKTLRVTGKLRELRMDKAYLDAWEARIKSTKPSGTEGDPCTEKCEESQAAAETLKRVQQLRDELAKSGKDYLSALWVDSEKWTVKTGKK